MKKYKVILANAPMINGNKGCVALSLSTIFLLDKILHELGADYELYLTDAGYKDGLLHYCVIQEKKIPFWDCGYPKGIDVRENMKIFLERFTKRKNAAKVFENADFILDIGQGDSFADIYGEKRFKKIDRIHRMALKYKKKYCILPQTIGPFSNKQIKRLADYSIEKSTLCMSRDRQSLEYIKKNVPFKNGAKEYIDVAFFLPYERVCFASDHINVGLNISGLLWNGGYTHDNQFELAADYQSIVRAIINYFMSIPDVKIHLVSHVARGEVNVENDYAVCYNLWKEFNNEHLVLAPFFFDPIEAKSYIAGLDFFMGARMHATIAAFSSNVPVIPMAYSRKFNGLFEDTLGYPYMVDLKKLGVEDIVNIVQNSFERRFFLRNIISERLNGVVKERKKILVDDLKNFFLIR